MFSGKEPASSASSVDAYRPHGAEGTAGAPENVITNAFRIQGPRRAQLDFLDVSIVLAGAADGARIRKDENRFIVKELLNGFIKTSLNLREPPLYAYDEEKTLVLVNITPSIPWHIKEHMDVQIRRNGPQNNDGTFPSRDFVITMTYTKHLDITEGDFVSQDNGRETARRVIERLQAVNLLLRQAISDTTIARTNNPNHVVVSMGDKVFANIKTEHFSVDAGEEWRAIWPGFTAAARVTRIGLVLNADQTHSVFFSDGFLHEIVKKILKYPRLTSESKIDVRTCTDLTTMFRGLLVEFLAPDGQEYGEGQLGKFCRSATDQFVQPELQNGLMVSQAYSDVKHALDYPDLPTVEVRLGGQTFRVPLEKCFLLPGQRYNKPLTKQEQAGFIRTVGKSPNERIESIAKFLNLSGVRNHPLMEQIGMSIDRDFIRITGRRLQQPTIEYGADGCQPIPVHPNDGSWTMPRDAGYHFPGELGQALALIFPNRSGGACIRPDALQQFLREMKAEGLRRGMAWEGTVQTVELRSERSFEKELTETLQKYSPKFVFGIFDRGMDRQYAEFKTVMDHEHGIPSQGLLSATVLRNPRGCIENILYKVNVKNGGINSILTEETFQSLDMLKQLFMVMGISLSHGKTKDAESKPSYAALVGSLDDSFKNWATEVMVTGSNEAILTDITAKVVTLLKTYQEHTGGFFPKVLIVYRDGVTRTHENDLMRNDIRCIKEAFRQLDVKIELIFIVVNKMHRTRFFKEPRKDSMGQMQYIRENIPPGLVVDSAVVDPFNDDFYLASHRGLLGTSRPIRYHVLVNEDAGATADGIQALTMSLAYIYQRCTMGVSIPAPLYYANLAAARCAVLADNIVQRLDREEGGGGRGRGGGRGGARGGPRGRGAPRGAGHLNTSQAFQRIGEGIQVHSRLKLAKRLSYI